MSVPPQFYTHSCAHAHGHGHGHDSDDEGHHHDHDHEHTHDNNAAPAAPDCFSEPAPAPAADTTAAAASTSTAAAAAAAAATQDPSWVRARLRAVLALMSARAAAYTAFDAGLRAYQRDRAAAPYHAACAAAMARFQRISGGIVAEEAALRDAGHARWAAAVRAVQDCEREKLRLTAQLHTLRAQFTVASDAPFAEDYTEGVALLRAALAEVVAEINAAAEDMRDAAYDLDGGAGDDAALAAAAAAAAAAIASGE